MKALSIYAAWSQLLILVFFVFSLSGCNSEHQEQAVAEPLPPLPVQVITAESSTPLRQVEIMGSIRAAQSASIAARVSGNITSLPVTLGSRVKKDDTLITIGAEEITAKLNQAQAQLEQVKRNLKREQNLLKKNAATPESVRTLEESLQISEAAYKEVRTMLGYTTIKAPFDGIITQKPANVGDLATPGKLLLQLESEASLQVIADIPEALVLGLTLGDQLPVSIEAAGLNITGRITEIAPTADPQSRTAPIKLDIQADPKIRSGQFVRISLPSTRGEAIMIPTRAIRPFGQLDRVFIIDNGTARMQLVKTGLQDDDRIEILGGLSAGDQVVVSDTTELSDGRQVIVE
jgi:RND family efflux transporter MFP subunit